MTVTAPQAGRRLEPRAALLRLTVVVGAGAGYVATVLWPWHHRAPDQVLVDSPVVPTVTGLVLVFTLPLVAYLAALPSVRALAEGRPRTVLHAAVLLAAVVAVAMYVSPWGLAATRGFLAD